MNHEIEERAVWFGRPGLGRAVAVHAVVLPDSLTVARLSVYGWGWLSVRTAAAPRAVPALRRFVRGRTVLELRVPAGEAIAVSVTNLWGRARAKFVITPTQAGAPRQAGLPGVVMPVPDRVLPDLPAGVGVPPFAHAVYPRMRVPGAQLAARLSPHAAHTGLCVLHRVGTQARMGAQMQRTLQALRDDTYST
jgi:hypothetical protein